MNDIVLKDGSVVAVTLKKNMKNIRLRVDRGKAYLSAPKGISKRRLTEFVLEREAWIAQKLLQTQKPSGLRLLGTTYQLRICKSDETSVAAKGDELYLFCRNTENWRKSFELWWKNQLTLRCDLYIKRYLHLFGHICPKPPAYSVRKMKSIWGSCTHRAQTLRFNYYLLNAPEECVEYVVFHEMAHMIYPNHGEDFKAFLTRYMPNWRDRKRLLAKEHTSNL